MLKFAAILTVTIGLLHSYLGERYLLVRLFRRENLPKLFGTEAMMKATTRFAWHITSVAWLGFAFILWSVSETTTDLRASVLQTIGAVFLISGLMSLVFSKGKHLSWLFFFTISALAFYQS